MSHFTHNRQPAVQNNNGGDDYAKYTKSQRAALKAYDRFYSWFPSFLDVFPDEDAFLEFACYFVITTIVVVIIASRYIKIKPSSFF